ncbi:AAA family ATPase [Luteolibacter algae]|uniref:AAA family ATPase n=1 Tax=Luteolibacter algae TaxID=454151 RepID=A0ABW5DE13_9BACT
MRPTAYISEISFSGGQIYQFDAKEKILLVGSNNSGKSQTLREIVGSSKDGKFERNHVVKGLKIEKTGKSSDLKAFLEEEADLVGVTYHYESWQIPGLHIQFWDEPLLLHSLSDGYIKNIAAESRLTICNQQNSISPGEQIKVPQHLLYDSQSLMTKISDLFKKAFGHAIFFNFRGGSKLPIHVGEVSSGSEVDRVSDSYVEEVRKNPLLDKQGDGMKSYAGILFEAVVSNKNITLIDEPEAFLHPPQMRRLGETLAQEVDGQLFVATHSSEIMRGFLEGTKGNVRILRISRIGEINFVTEAGLTPENRTAPF